MDQFGDVIYNNYNATEAGMIATATPARPAGRSRHRGQARTRAPRSAFLDTDFREVPDRRGRQIYVRNSTQFDGYTSGNTKDFHEGFMSSGDVGYLDGNGRLFVVGRDDEMIVSGGENVYPIEVEKTLAPTRTWPRPRSRGRRRAVRSAAGGLRRARRWRGRHVRTP